MRTSAHHCLFKHPCSRSRLRRRAAFSLLEMVLALTIFSIAIVGLTQCLVGTLYASADNVMLGRIRLSLQNRLAEARIMPLEQERVMEASDIPEVSFQREVQPFPVRNAKGHQITGLFVVRITATWDSSSGITTEFAEIYLPATPAGAARRP